VSRRTCSNEAAGPVSRILSAVAGRTIIPLGPALLRGSSDLPGGYGAPSQHASRRRPKIFTLKFAASSSYFGARNISRRKELRAAAGSSSLFGLAPCGVCPARAITDAAVRSYRTFSPLPRRRCLGFVILREAKDLGVPRKSSAFLPTNESRFSHASLQNPYNDAAAVYFLWHFPSTRLEPGVPDVIRHTALRSSDFPPRPFSLAGYANRPSCDWNLRNQRGRTGGAIVRPGCLPIHYSAHGLVDIVQHP
jgi:hypothetical protein